MNMSKNPRKRAKIPFQPSEEVTIPLGAVCGSGSSYSTSTYPYDPNDPTTPQVDPIQVGPTG
jgi:hypothetical protein